MKEDFVVIIPARYAATRLPGKPLRKIAGLPMILHTVARAADSGAVAVYVATDDERIKDVCHAASVEVVMTRGDHESGSDRLAEVCDSLQLANDAIVVNVQGDEPLIDPAVITQVATLLMDNPGFEMASLCHAIDDESDLFDPNVVKVVCAADGRALYFSRAPIPFDRARYSDAVSGTELVSNLKSPPSGGGLGQAPGQALRHLGLYAYRAGYLRQFVQLVPAPIERLEALEQLRALHHGAQIMMAQACAHTGPGVDTERDLARVEALMSDADAKLR